MLTNAPDSEFIKLLRSTTRECSFDFNEVALRIRYHYQEKGVGIKEHERNYLHITAPQCREHFATDYGASSCQTSGMFASVSTVDSNLPQTSDDVLKLQQRLEEESRISHARIFERVYHSLGIDATQSDLGSNDEVVAAIEQRAAERRKREAMQSQRNQEIAEATALKEQRERLRNRYNENSLDAEGINPLSEEKSDGRLNVVHTSYSVISSCLFCRN